LNLAFERDRSRRKLKIKLEIDVTRFLKPAEQRGLVLWSARFFRDKVERIQSNC
jgi:hypothetical protein